LINKLDGVTGVQQHNRLDAIREANSVKKEDRTDRMEDYLEVIYELVEQKGYATTVDISNFLNVSSSSVTKMMQRLDDTGYLKYEKYRGIRLTEDGIRIAQNIRSRHGLLAEFFRIIGVDEESANNDAEGIEHHLHPETIRKLEEFINILKKNPSLLKRL
jgi:Mn-dependent DtxR family transcriptional regulator